MSARDWRIIEPSPRRSLEELEAEVERFRAALEQANRERRVLFAEVFKLTYELARRDPRRKACLHGSLESIKRTERRPRQHGGDALAFLLLYMGWVHPDDRDGRTDLDKLGQRKIKPTLLREITTRNGRT